MGIAARLFAILILGFSGQSITHAAASAEIDFSINGGQNYKTFLDSTGVSDSLVVPISITLAPGQSAIFNIHYRIKTFDDGLITTAPTSLISFMNGQPVCQANIGCNPLYPKIPIISQENGIDTLSEFSFAALSIVQSISQYGGIYIRSKGEYGTLKAGSGADRSILFGTQHLIFTNKASNFSSETGGFTVSPRVWVVATPVPEPAAALNLAGGLCLLLLVWFRRTASARAPSV